MKYKNSGNTDLLSLLRTLMLCDYTGSTFQGDVFENVIDPDTLMTILPYNPLYTQAAPTNDNISDCSQSARDGITLLYPTKADLGLTDDSTTSSVYLSNCQSYFNNHIDVDGKHWEMSDSYTHGNYQTPNGFVKFRCVKLKEGKLAFDFWRVYGYTFTNKGTENNPIWETDYLDHAAFDKKAGSLLLDIANGKCYYKTADEAYSEYTMTEEVVSLLQEMFIDQSTQQFYPAGNGFYHVSTPYASFKILNQRQTKDILDLEHDKVWTYAGVNSVPTLADISDPSSSFIEFPSNFLMTTWSENNSIKPIDIFHGSHLNFNPVTEKLWYSNGEEIYNITAAGCSSCVESHSAENMIA